jgi:FlaA1/EpsC-like NDP-sugar epimerase
MAHIFGATRPQVVIHAAALKHVDLVEAQPCEAVQVNVLGTWNCAQEAERVGAESFVLISTDKAVDPVGVLGASKRLGELMVASLHQSQTLFTAVRFGNVIGSRGSALPRFEQQISVGGPLTITHPDVRRYFMSISEAVSLVLETTVIAKRGRVYVLDMGEEVRIVDVATRLAQLHGMRVPEDIQIVFTGMRPGERMSEQLIGRSEAGTATEHPKISEVVGLRVDDQSWILSALDELTPLTGGDAPILRERLLDLATRGGTTLAAAAASDLEATVRGTGGRNRTGGVRTQP